MKKKKIVEFDKLHNNITPKGKKEFYVHLSNGDTDDKPDYKEEVLGDVDFELDVGQEWILITRKPLSTKKYLALMDMLRDQTQCIYFKKGLCHLSNKNPFKKDAPDKCIFSIGCKKFMVDKIIKIRCMYCGKINKTTYGSNCEGCGYTLMPSESKEVKK